MRPLVTCTGGPTNFDACILDMDGTVYLGDELLPGAARFITAVRERGIPLRLLSNNATHSPAQHAGKLTRLGLPTRVDDIANSIVTTVRWLHTDIAMATAAGIPSALVLTGDSTASAAAALPDDSVRPSSWTGSTSCRPANLRVCAA